MFLINLLFLGHLVENHIGLLFKPLIKTGQTRWLNPLNQFETKKMMHFASPLPVPFKYLSAVLNAFMTFASISLSFDVLLQQA